MTFLISPEVEVHCQLHVEKCLSEYLTGKYPLKKAQR